MKVVCKNNNYNNNIPTIYKIKYITKGDLNRLCIIIVLTFYNNIIDNEIIRFHRREVLQAIKNNAFTLSKDKYHTYIIYLYYISYYTSMYQI